MFTETLNLTVKLNKFIYYAFLKLSQRLALFHSYSLNLSFLLFISDYSLYMRFCLEFFQYNVKFLGSILK